MATSHSQTSSASADGRASKRDLTTVVAAIAGAILFVNSLVNLILRALR